MHLREVSDFDDSVTQFNASDDGAPTMMKTQDSDSGVIEISHQAPVEATATDFTYRDQAGRLHEVKVIDRPTDDFNGDGNEQRNEKQEKALRDLQGPGPEPESPVERRDWNQSG